jgi:hypothetical protein
MDQIITVSNPGIYSRADMPNCQYEFLRTLPSTVESDHLNHEDQKIKIKIRSEGHSPIPDKRDGSIITQ